MKKRGRENAGNSVLEVLMAMVVTAIAATAATGGLVSTTNLLGENTRYQEAITLAQQSLERSRTIPYDEIISSTQSTNGYTIARTVLDGTPEVGMKHITVTVSWTWKGQPRNYALRTVFGEISKS